MMLEPKIHSGIVPELPEDHWLNEALDYDDTWACQRCGFIVYTRPRPNTSADVAPGTHMTWVESGLVLGGDKPTDPHVPYILCIVCFRTQRTVWPTLKNFWLLNDDGTPQPPRLASWVRRNLTEHHAGLDLFNDPPVEVERYRRLPGSQQRGHDISQVSVETDQS